MAKSNKTNAGYESKKRNLLEVPFFLAKFIKLIFCRNSNYKVLCCEGAFLGMKFFAIGQSLKRYAFMSLDLLLLARRIWLLVSNS